LVLPHLIGARIVAGYHPMKDEISPYAVLDLLHESQTRALPVVPGP
jgi:5-formyltetrahydrofolate cyclo-ligase